MAFDDPLRAGRPAQPGEAFAGTVVEAEPGRVVTTDANRRMPRPRVTVRTRIPSGWPPTPS